MTWAALREGLGGTDWLTPFEALLRKTRPDNVDWVSRRPTMDLKGFTDKPAKWADACRTMQAALVFDGIDAETAVSYSMHSFRHTLPTMGRQLLMSDPHDQCDGQVGCW